MMTKTEAIKEKIRLINEIAKLNKIINPVNFDIDVFLTNIFKENIVFSNWSVYPNSFYIFDKKNNFLFEYDFINKILWLSFKNIISKVNKNLNYDLPQSLNLLSKKIAAIFDLQIIRIECRDNGIQRTIEESLTPKSFQ